MELEAEQQEKLDRAEAKVLFEFITVADNLAQGKGSFNEHQILVKAPFLSCCSIMRQEKVVTAIQAESANTAALLKATREAAEEMRKDSRWLKRLTWALVFLTVVLAILAFPPFVKEATALWREGFRQARPAMPTASQAIATP